MQKQNWFTKKENIFIIMLAFLSLALFVKTYGQGVAITDLEKLRFAQIITVIQYLVLFLFMYICLKTVKKDHMDNMCLLLIFYSILTVPYYCGYDQFGTRGIMMVTVTLLYALFTFRGKWNALFFVVPVAGMILQAEYIFSYFNIFALLLFYQCCQEKDETNKKRWKYRLVVSVVIAFSLLVGFLVSDIAGHSNWIQMGKKDMLPHGGNLLEMLFMCVLFSPYLFLALRLFQDILKRADEKGEKRCYGGIVFGGLSVLPLFLLHCHYGKWIFALISYYMIVLLTLLSKGDEVITGAVYGLMDRMKKRYGWSVLLLIYPVMFVPFGEMNICGITRMLAEDVKGILQIMGVM